jgi:hypothetical protein
MAGKRVIGKCIARNLRILRRVFSIIPQGGRIFLFCLAGLANDIARKTIQCIKDHHEDLSRVGYTARHSTWK